MPWTDNPTQGGIKYFQYTQNTAATSWVINHGMGEYPAMEIFVYDDSNTLQKAYPLNLTHLDLNTVQIDWTHARRGYVTFAG